MKKVKEKGVSKQITGTIVLAFLKNNIYFVLMVVCILALAAVITIAAVVNSNKNTIVPTDNQTAVTPDGTNNVEIPSNQNTPVNKEEPSPIISNNNENTSFVLIVPVSNATIGTSFSNDELVWNSTQKHWATHEGIDYMADAGSEVLCSYDGTVTSVETDGYNGTVVKVSHRDGFSTIYKLIEGVSLKVNDIVSQGQKIGVISADALAEIAQGPHLHFELEKDGVNIDPSLYMLSGDK